MNSAKYYTDVDWPALDMSLIASCQAVCEAAITSGEFSQFSHYTSTEKFIDIKQTHAVLHDMTKQCRYKSWVTVMLLPPNFVMDIHRDTYYLESRKTAILVPLLPTDDIAPTYFWQTKESTKPLVTIDWQVGKPKLLNVMPHWHNVVNNDSWRAMLQFSFDREYEEVVDALKQRNLFQGIDCGLTCR